MTANGKIRIEDGDRSEAVIQLVGQSVETEWGDCCTHGKVTGPLMKVQFVEDASEPGWWNTVLHMNGLTRIESSGVEVSPRHKSDETDNG